LNTAPTSAGTDSTRHDADARYYAGNVTNLDFVELLLEAGANQMPRII
jgi:hypothetical protein